ncbi:unnamed protein product [Kluyveromyces dobzhanskii CBS 2104]|uniref:WGS project CCBQ000000000 data, contig 00015 n=1 Tax=Kluyveromyces dobzhanskii CBS 2104 TaxID=1427455 RepID=A0A0A8LCE1_9SACH|nr:unnamed protein product [Kluyveromyces dobzhanskii CBS 2104]
MGKPWILFIAEPEYSLEEYDLLKQDFNTVNYILERDIDGSGKEAFLKFLDDHSKQKGPIVGIFGGYPQFAPLGGLHADILNDPRWPDSVKCICICSVGYNGIDLELLQQKGVELYNYDDTIQDSGIVANDVADCVLWHVLDGFRKFSSQMHALRSARNTIKARAEVILEEGQNHAPGFEFGHRWKRGRFNESCRGKKCLIMGLGRIGVQCGKKLALGLGMEIHYTQRKRAMAKETESENIVQSWQFHPIFDLLHGTHGGQDSTSISEPDRRTLNTSTLAIFDCIVICLPGTSSTYHMVNKAFLSQCKDGVVICNFGRGTLIDDAALQEVTDSKPGRILHVALDVFHAEPVVEQWIAEDHHYNSITPHIASSTNAVWTSSNRLALQVLGHVCVSAVPRESLGNRSGKPHTTQALSLGSKLAPALARKSPVPRLPRVV